MKTRYKSKRYHALLQRFCIRAWWFSVLFSHFSGAESLNVAVASNFAPTMESIKQEFEQSSSHSLKLIKGSSGKHYAQISHGAPFDVFLSADQLRPQRLEAQGLIVEASRRTYAIGQLALWSRQPELMLDLSYLSEPTNYRRLAIANPNLAPYGKAAMEVLAGVALFDELRPKLVRGENVAQTFQFAYSGSVPLAIVAYSQVLASPVAGSYWLLPTSLHEPIRQDMVLLTRSPASLEFARFMSGPVVSAILRDSGYLVPEPSATSATTE